MANALDFVINVIQKMGGDTNAADQVAQLHSELDEATKHLAKMEAAQRRVGRSAAALEKVNASLTKAQSTAAVAAGRVGQLEARHAALSADANANAAAIARVNVQLLSERARASAAAAEVERLQKLQAKHAQAANQDAGALQRINVALDQARTRYNTAADAVSRAQLQGPTEQVGALSGAWSGLLGRIGMVAGPVGIAIASLAILRRVVTGVFHGAVALGGRIKDAYLFGEGLQFSLSKFLGSQDTARQEIQKTLDLSNRLRIDFRAAGEQFKDAVSAGFTADAARDLIALKADLFAMSTGSSDALQRIENAFVQINKAQAKGRIEADGFNSILENLPVTKMQILDKLAPRLGKSVEQLAKTEITKLPVDELIASIKEATLSATNATELGQVAAAGRIEKVGGAWAALKARALNTIDGIAARIQGSQALIGILNEIENALASERGAAMVNAIGDGISFALSMASKGWPLFKGFIEGLLEGLEGAGPGIEMALSFFNAPGGSLEDNAATAREFGAALGSLVGDIAQVVAWMVTLASWGQRVVTLVNPFRSAGGAVGGALVDGMTLGISDGASKVYAKVAEVASGAIKAARNAFVIRSPARPFVEMGEQTDHGLIAGAVNLMPKVLDTYERLARGAIGAAHQGFRAAPTVDDSVRSRVGFRPRIAVRSGASEGEGGIHVHFHGDINASDREELNAIVRRKVGELLVAGALQRGTR